MSNAMFNMFKANSEVRHGRLQESGFVATQPGQTDH